MAQLADLLARSRASLDALRAPSTQATAPDAPAAPVPPSAAGGVSGALEGLLRPYQQAVQGTQTGATGFEDLNPLEWILGRAAKTLAEKGRPATAPSPGTAPGADTSAQGLVSRRGVQLTPDAMQSLLEAAREYKAIAGTRELGLFGPQATYRTQAEQAALYAAKPGIAAPPGQSLHQEGRAIDLPAQLQTPAFFNILRRLGWYQLPGEPWHWSAPGYRG